jgi:hypothetical protein
MSGTRRRFPKTLHPPQGFFSRAQKNNNALDCQYIYALLDLIRNICPSDKKPWNPASCPTIRKVREFLNQNPARERDNFSGCRASQHTLEATKAMLSFLWLVLRTVALIPSCYAEATASDKRTIQKNDMYGLVEALDSVLLLFHSSPPWNVYIYLLLSRRVQIDRTSLCYAIGQCKCLIKYLHPSLPSRR